MKQKLLLTFFATAFALCSWANGVIIDGINYVLTSSNKTACVTYTGSYYSSNNTYTGSVVIPETVTYDGTTYSVTSIGNDAFSWCTGLTSITIPESVTSIGSRAFEYCRGLTSITIPESVTSIGSYAFYGCTGLMSITIPNSVTSIGEWAFSDCSNLTSITLNNSVIGDHMFEYCRGLTSITIPESVTSIGSYAFYGCTGLMSITIPNSVTSIGSYAFYGCTGLMSITIPNSVTSIGWSAFDGCTGLMNITINNSVIGSSMFEGCTGLTSITIPESVTSIGSSAFKRCSNLTSITIPESVTSIGSSAFSYCTNLVSVTIESDAIVSKNYTSSSNLSSIFGSQVTKYVLGDNVISIGDYAFSGCTGVTSITIPNSVTSIGSNAFEDTPWYKNQENGMVYIGLVAYKYKGTMQKNTSILINEGTRMIGNDAFSSCTGLTSITIPETVTSIGSGAFSGCTGLTSITIPNSVTSIGSNAFEDTPWYKNQENGMVYIGLVAYKYKGTMQKNTSILINEGTRMIGNDAFKNCEGLTSITIPNSVTNIGNKAFYGCTGLTNVTIPNSVNSIGDWAFYECTGVANITIPESVTSLGYAAFSYCSNLTSITLNNSVIGGRMFEHCPGLTSITIPESVTSIGYSAFSGCSNLTSITIPKSVTSIGYSAFSGCSNLTSITLNNSVIGDCMFEFCKGLTSVTIPESVTSIGGYAFSGCSNLTSITIPESVTSIGIRAFYGCSNLTSITLNNSVIGDCMFEFCTGLTIANIPNSVTSIGDGAFQSCHSLKTVSIGKGVTSIESCAFQYCSADIIIWSSKNINIGSNCFTNSGHSNIYTFANNVLELSETKHDEYFKNCNVYSGIDIINKDIYQAKINLCSTSLYNLKKIEMDGRVFNAEDGNIQCTQLTPNKTYTLTVTGQVRDCDIDYTFDVDLTTEDLSLWLKQTDATNITLSVEGDNEGDAQIVGYSFLANEAQNSGNLAKGKWKAKGLKPKQRVQVDMTARTIDGYTKTITRYFDTKDLDVTFDAQTTGTSAMLTGSASMIDATYLSSCFKESGRDQVIIYGLDPYSSYSWPFYVTTKEGGEVPYYTSFRTQGLYMNTQSAQPLTTTKARLIANTNCDDDALRCGFEWIRYDAPAEMKPTSVSCPVYNGVIMGTLNGVNPDTYYKYRPYYQSDSGQRYYGDWVAFITGDASVYFEPEIHTLAASDITSNSAKVRGYAVAGSDEISEQGFEYWTETSGTQRKESSGTLMQTTLSGLMPSTKYFYRSYAKTGTKTTYGEERDFTTNPDATGIEFISTDTPERTVIGYYNLQGQRTSEPQRGLNIIRYSDGTSKKVLVK